MKKKDRRLRSSLENRNKKRELRITEFQQMENERRNMEKNANSPFWWKDTSVWTLSLHGISKFNTTSFMVILKKPIPTVLIHRKLIEAFRDLDGQEVRV